MGQAGLCRFYALIALLRTVDSNGTQNSLPRTDPLTVRWILDCWVGTTHTVPPLISWFGSAQVRDRSVGTSLWS